MTGELSQRALMQAAAEGLRKLAADPRCRTALATPGSALYDLLTPAARRYVLAPDRDRFLHRIAALRAKGYLVTAEYAAEHPAEYAPERTAERVAAAPEHGGEHSGEPCCGQVVEEYLALLSHEPAPERLGFDLSRMGLARSPELAARNTGRIAAAAAARGSEIVLGMEGLSEVDAVLAVYRELSARYANVGVTLQAQLHRTEQDALAVARPGRTIRLVKGALPEPAQAALPRGPALDDRFLELAQRLVDRGARLSLATQDPAVLAAAGERGLLERAAEIEMPHGVQPHLLRRYREAGRVCRIHTVYGTNWWPHLMRRLAEHPPTVLSALADIGAGRADAEGIGY
ncbi:proline dehydrogenase family protein [Streptomyces jumonjinensis]|uniref:Proline dehydrogenase n=1 Tax=Streptomyces jumonjinensis TaxID=1945 RepID=A0A646KQV9_STRJU|nr:proline dehydrogenase family protein [Streptomyces jumonjinensis]MQT04714.1 proline dehydrogenase [Streptomyces jumonjinensis]